MHNAVRIDVSDNVATVLRDVAERERIGWDEGSGLVARESIPEGHKVALVDIVPEGHKVALVDIDEGQVVRKYGHPIGLAGRKIPAGSHVHSHNLAKEEA